ncbi:hypothetical protein CC80DRAFT_429371 [Byssothecium circinans]|uniref:Uncharacterized protein n=1 Tax=Byssothecium circinans TaxID=147558 RepID=A0A6A5TKA5_9PLEO|nr:hypothetical protein CC80DRAFT_429371 [Byssothecium circinans]
MITSSHSAIRSDLAVLPVEKWGWVIYRCTYADNTAWTRFRDRVEAISRESIAESDAPEIADRLEWTWVEDPVTLDGASTAALRERFRAWAADEVARQPGDYDPVAIPRFNFFVKVDEEALQSVAGAAPPGMPWPRDSFVKFVDASWESSPVNAGEGQGQEYDDSEPEIFEPIDGCIEEDVGWIRISPFMIRTDFYDVWCGVSDLWNVWYERPPKIVYY